MNIKSLLTAFLLITFYSSGFGQKIKYKDLMVLLDAKRYEEAEPYLKKFLKENTDNPSAYLYMGIVYREKAAKVDLLKDTHKKVMFLDSVVYFISKAKPMITEKEVKKNSDNYQQYMRRNFTTGKYDITFSDVQLSMDDMLKLKERGTTYLTLKAQLTASQNAYTRAQRLYVEMLKPYISSKEFYLRADEKMLNDLKYLAQIYDSCHINFNDYKQTTEVLGGKTGYNQDIDPQEILTFKADGQSTADFYRDDLKIWDYKRWALSNLEKIEKEFIPLHESLVATDAEINKLHQKLKKDSTAITSEIAAIRGKIFYPELKKIDSAPLPLKVFDVKLAELDYGSKVSADRNIKDSVRIALHVNAVKEELSLAKRIDSLSSLLLSDATLETEAINYKNFVTKAFGSLAVMKEQIRASKEFAEKEIAKKDQYLKSRSESLRWIISAPDSIPLFMEVSSKSRFRPFVLLDDKFTSGIQFGKDSIATGYFYTITPSRKSDIKAAYPIDKQIFIRRNLPFTKALGIQDEGGKVFFVLLYSEAKISNKFPATLAKIYRQEGLAWSINYSFDQLPAEVTYSPETFEISVKTKSSVGETFVVAFDKMGKLLK